MTIVWLAWQVKFVGVPAKPDEISQARWQGMLCCVNNYLKTEMVL